MATYQLIIEKHALKQLSKIANKEIPLLKTAIASLQMSQDLVAAKN